MKERIAEFLKRENKSSALFAEEIGVQPSGISHILSGRNKPSLDFVIKMLEKYPYIDVEWLLFGKGKMYKPNAIPDLFGNYPDLPPGDEEREDITNRAKEKDLIEDQTLYSEESGKQKMILPESEGSAVKRIVLFFSDNSFEDYQSKKQQ